MSGTFEYRGNPADNDVVMQVWGEHRDALTAWLAGEHSLPENVLDAVFRISPAVPMLLFPRTVVRRANAALARDGADRILWGRSRAADEAAEWQAFRWLAAQAARVGSAVHLEQFEAAERQPAGSDERRAALASANAFRLAVPLRPAGGSPAMSGPAMSARDRDAIVRRLGRALVPRETAPGAPIAARSSATILPFRKPTAP